MAIFYLVICTILSRVAKYVERRGPMENKITVKQLKKSFGDLEVLKDINIEIKEGEVA